MPKSKHALINAMRLALLLLLRRDDTMLCSEEVEAIFSVKVAAAALLPAQLELPFTRGNDAG